MTTVQTEKIARRKLSLLEDMEGPVARRITWVSAPEFGGARATCDA